MLDTSEGPSWELHSPVTCSGPGNAFNQVCYQCCTRVPRYQMNSICWDLRDLSPYFDYQMVALTFKYHVGYVICQIFCVGCEKTLKLKTFLLLYWKQLLSYVSLIYSSEHFIVSYKNPWSLYSAECNLHSEITQVFFFFFVFWAICEVSTGISKLTHQASCLL